MRTSDEKPFAVRPHDGGKGQKQAKRGQKWAPEKSLLRFFIVFEVDNSYLERECVLGLVKHVFSVAYLT
jgi:hypothetical protein